MGLAFGERSEHFDETPTTPSELQDVCLSLLFYNSIANFSL